MRLSKKGEYAVRAMIALGLARGESLTISEIAAAQGLPKKFLEQIMLALKSAGLTVSKAGPRGGYGLARPASEITLKQILGAVEEPLSGGAVVRNMTGGNADLGRLQALLEDIRIYARRRLDGLTLQDLAQEGVPNEDMQALMWYI
jgi:Rrf2 family protein